MREIINKPTTLYIKFPGGNPRLFCLFDESGKTYFFRYLDGMTPRIKVNIPDSGTYEGNCPFEVYKREPIELPGSWPTLPPAQRDRWKPVTIVKDPGLRGTPAQIFTDTGLIKTAPVFDQYPLPVQKFLIEHEKGHFFYVDENACDLFALINYLRMGYNASMAYATMSKILGKSRENIQRLKDILNSIQKTQTQKL